MSNLTYTAPAPALDRLGDHAASILAEHLRRFPADGATARQLRLALDEVHAMRAEIAKWTGTGADAPPAHQKASWAA